MPIPRFLLLSLLLLPWPALGDSNRLLIHAGELLAHPEKPTQQSVTIAVEDGVIHSVMPGFVSAAELGWNDSPVPVLDLTSAFVLPGLIDLHVHLTSPAEPGGDLRVATMGPADLALMALDLGQRNLSAGFTTVLDLGTGRGDHVQAIHALRDAIKKGRIPGPRIISAGSPISPTGASRTGKFRADIDAVIPPQGVCDGADDCRRAVREQIARGADVINVYNTGSLNDEYIAPQTFTDEEFVAIVETAHALGRVVVADGHTAAGINAALRAGADIVDTAPWPDEESWRLMRESGAAFEPHLYAFENAVGDAPDSLEEGTMHWIPSPILRRLYDIKSKPYSAERAYREGIPIVFGSDTGVIPHGDNAGEFSELVKIGMSATEAIASATTNAARVLNLDHEIGSLEAGKAADLIATKQSPLKDVRELQSVMFVMRKGVVFKNDL